MRAARVQPAVPEEGVGGCARYASASLEPNKRKRPADADTHNALRALWGGIVKGVANLSLALS